MALVPLSPRKRPEPGPEPEVEMVAPEDVPDWMVQPATPVSPLTDKEIIERANAYFKRCYEQEEIPRLTEFALALGLPGVSSIYRLGRRRADLAWSLSRCITVIASHFERMLHEGGSYTKGAIFMLKHLRDFDPTDGPGAPEMVFWRDTQHVEVDSHISGVERAEDKGKELTAEEAYMTLIQGGSGEILELVKKKAVPAEATPTNTLSQALAKIEEAEWHDV